MERDPIQGDLQEAVMTVMWRLGKATVAEVREAIPASSRGAYTTVQTVLNRLAERNLLNRELVGNAISYSPRLSEADYLTSSLRRALNGASEEAQKVALARLAGDDTRADQDSSRRQRRG